MSKICGCSPLAVCSLCRPDLIPGEYPTGGIAIPMGKLLPRLAVLITELKHAAFVAQWEAGVLYGAAQAVIDWMGDDWYSEGREMIALQRTLDALETDPCDD